MFEAVPGESKPQRKAVHTYPIALELINAMMPAVLEAVHEHEMLRRKLFQARTLRGAICCSAIGTQTCHSNA